MKTGKLGRPIAAWVPGSRCRGFPDRSGQTVMSPAEEKGTLNYRATTAILLRNPRRRVEFGVKRGKREKYGVCEVVTKWTSFGWGWVEEELVPFCLKLLPESQAGFLATSFSVDS